MLQTVVGEYRPASVGIDPDALARFASTRAAIGLSSTLVWAEHCTECVMPSCYSTCALYTPRRDLKCRRFDRGLEAARAAGETRRLGMRVSFRRWGKLESAPARPAALSPLRAWVLGRADAWVAGVLAAAPLPHRLEDGVSILWNRAKARAASRGAGAAAFEAFLIECFSQTPRDCVFTFSLKPAVSTGRYFQRHFSVKPGYNRIEIPLSEIRAAVDLDAPVLAQIEPVDAPADNAFIFGCLDFVAFRTAQEGARNRGPAALSGAPAPGGPARPAAKVKCVVWDLDNTVWRGTLIEDGVEALRLNPEAARAIKALDERGILHSIASKNNAEEALAALDRFGLRDYFLAPQIGWGPKSAALSEIARRLNIHPNSFLFVDDQPFERAEVLSVHPDVRVIEETRIGGLLELPEVDQPVTAEGRNRRAMYRVEERREAAFGAADATFLEFLRGCAIELTIREAASANIGRVFELAQRTNQLNYAGRACSRGEIEELASRSAPGKAGLALSCSDRFGDYGVIGFAVVDVARFHVENFFMSCRVQHKKVDHAFFAWLIERAMAQGRDRVSTNFHFSGRNQSARQVLEEMRFSPSGETDVLISPRLEDLPERDLVKVIDKTRALRQQPPERALAG